MSAVLDQLTADAGLVSRDGWRSEVAEAAAIREDLHSLRDLLAPAASGLLIYASAMLAGVQAEGGLADVIAPDGDDGTLLELAVVCGQVAAFRLGGHNAGSAAALHEDLAAVHNTSTTCPSTVVILLNAVAYRTGEPPGFIELQPGRCTIGEARVWAGLLTTVLRRAKYHDTRVRGW